MLLLEPRSPHLKGQRRQSLENEERRHTAIGRAERRGVSLSRLAMGANQHSWAQTATPSRSRALPFPLGLTLSLSAHQDSKFAVPAEIGLSGSLETLIVPATSEPIESDLADVTNIGSANQKYIPKQFSLVNLES